MMAYVLLCYPQFTIKNDFYFTHGFLKWHDKTYFKSNRYFCPVTVPTDIIIPYSELFLSHANGEF